WIRQVAARRARALGWASRSSESVDDRELRRHLVPWVAMDGEDPVLQSSAQKLALGWLDERTGLDDDQVEAGVPVRAPRGRPAPLEAMLREGASAPVRVDRTRIIDALGHVTEPTLAARARALVDDSRFDLRDAARVLQIQMSEPQTRAEAWPVLRDRIGEL